jgi:hypothetical protein
MHSIVGSQICKENWHSNLEISKLFLKHQQTPWHESVSKLCRPSECCLLVRLVRAFADGGCHVVSVTDPCYCSWFSGPELLLFLPGGSSVVLAGLGGPRSGPATSWKVWWCQESSLGALATRPQTSKTLNDTHNT